MKIKVEIEVDEQAWREAIADDWYKNR